MNELRAENIFAAYRKKEVLRGVSLTLKQGETVALIGPNGAGKSTLVKVIAGFLMPQNGSVWVNGTEVTALLPHERVRLGIAYFMQGGKVFPNLTTLENIEMGSMSLSSHERTKKIRSVLEVFPNLKDLFEKRAGLLSGGERQSLALAMVLVKHPNVLLLDEPSAGLSPKLVQEILARVIQLNVTWGTTILLVEQNVREALKISNRALALVNGEVVLETGEPQAWLAKGQLDQLFLGRAGS